MSLINNNERKVISYFSFLKVIACIGVIIAHAFMNSYSTYKDTLTETQKYISQFGTVSFMWAVPIFVMVSGALFLDKKREISITTLLRKYIGRMLTALVIFVFVYRLLDAWFYKETFGIHLIIDGFYKVITGTGATHLWYLYALIGLYLILPLLKRFALNATDVEFKFILLVMFLFLGVGQLLSFVNISFGFYIHISTIYPFYFLMGYAIHNEVVSFDKVVSILMIIVGFFIIGWSVYGDVYHQWENMNFLWNYPSVSVVLESVGLFSLATNYKKESRYIQFIDGCSFGIYLIHMVFIRYLLMQMGVNPYQGHLVINVFGIVVVTFALSTIATFILKKFPGLMRIL